MSTNYVLQELLPHRPPMLLLREVLELSANHAKALVELDEDSPFLIPGQGVPACVGLEYMGQTAALIAGYQLQKGIVGAHLGFLLGSRRYHASCEVFAPGSRLQVDVEEAVVVGESLASFNCVITSMGHREKLCEATLSVLRKPAAEEAP